MKQKKKKKPSTFVFSHIKVTGNQNRRKMKILEAELFDEINNDNKICSHVPSRTKKFIILMNAEDSLEVKKNLIFLTSSTNERSDKDDDEGRSF